MKKKYRVMVIGIDADGTCFTHEFPKIGRDIGAVPVLKDLVSHGHKLILFTGRANVPAGVRIRTMYGNKELIITEGNYLDDAVNWFRENNIPLYGIQRNPNYPNESWISPKVHVDMFIDNISLGCPLAYTLRGESYVDWKKVREILTEQGIL